MVDGKRCLKCDHVRTAQDTGPEWGCPKCGAVYAKLEAAEAGTGVTYSAASPAPPRGASKDHSEPRSSGRYYRRREWTAAMALVGGNFGLHHFWLGNTRRGLLNLLFFWTLIPELIAIVEAFGYLRMDDADWHERYNRGADPDATTWMEPALVTGVVALGVAAAFGGGSIPGGNKDEMAVLNGLDFALMTARRVGEFAVSNQRFPDRTGEVVSTEKQPTDVKDMSIGPGGVIRVTLRDDLKRVGGGSILLSPSVQQGVIDWKCAAEGIPAKYLIELCK